MLIRELIHIKERVNKDDFVLKLTEGVGTPDTTLGDYVVTADLVQNFDDALGFIKGAIDTRRSRGTYLHGSFGSGKSHFMAVLNLLLQGNTVARALPKLAPVVAKYNAMMQGKKFLMVPYHMIGAKTLEDRIFSGYVEWIKSNHPEAEVPPLFRSKAILENAAALRKKMGDTAFFNALNEGKEGNHDGWGDLSGDWNASSYEAAAAAPDGGDHANLVSDLVDGLLTSIKTEGEYLDLDQGLVALSRHAQSLGYHGVILFLDELVLWLASRSGSIDFLNQEVNKLAKLVEAQNMNRPIPIISFIARQRDLRELIGENVAGAANLNFLDQLKYFEGRFETIMMGDNNLPEITSERLLRPISAGAKAQIDTEFDNTTAVRQEIRDVLLTSKSNKEAFRKLYPFSPALVETLIAVSAMLQRERTALRILLQLLVDGRDTLKLGELVPVGDLYDQISKGDDAFSSEMRKHFKTADQLYRQNFRPMLEEINNLSFDEAAKLPFDDVQRTNLRNDDRLIKTVILAALAPEVETLKSLTPHRLAALNHGTIKSRIPGQEASIVLNKLREWAGRVGQLKVDDSSPPIVSIQLTGVNIERILEKADGQDNFGNRLRCLKEILYKQLNLSMNDKLWLEHTFMWRGTQRLCKILFKNVWDAALDTFDSDGDDWKLVIDYPMDAEASKSPADDRANLTKYKNEKGTARTVVWLPSFFSDQALRDLGKLVKLETILAEHAFEGYVSDLSMQDKTTAKSILSNQRDALKQRMRTYLQTAYGLQQDRSGIVNDTKKLEGVDHFHSLEPNYQPSVPGETHLEGAMNAILRGALDSQYPKHPKFDDDLKLTPQAVQKVHDIFGAALQQTEGRVEAPQNQRDGIRDISNPLKLGEMSTQYYVPGEFWKDHFRRQAPDGLDGVSVKEMRGWIDWGIPPILENLIILCCARQLNCGFTHHGGAFEPTLKDLSDELKLKPQILPDPEVWEKAKAIQHSLLGLSDLPKILNGSSIDEFSNKVKAEAAKYINSVAQLVTKLESEAAKAKISGDFDRLETAKEAHAFLRLIQNKPGSELIKGLSSFTCKQPETAISTTVKGAAALLHALPLKRDNLEMALSSLTGELKNRAESLSADLQKALKANEYVTSLAAATESINSRALGLLGEQLKAGHRSGTKEGEKAQPKEERQEAATSKAGSVTQLAAASELIALYGKSQVEGDDLPDWVNPELARLILKIHLVGSQSDPDRSNLIVLSPNLLALIEACEDAEIDLDSKVLRIPSRGIEQPINVLPNHNG